VWQKANEIKGFEKKFSAILLWKMTAKTITRSRVRGTDNPLVELVWCRSRWDAQLVVGDER
jgi:hypothetical protein